MRREIIDDYLFSLQLVFTAGAGFFREHSLKMFTVSGMTFWC